MGGYMFNTNLSLRVIFQLGMTAANILHNSLFRESFFLLAVVVLIVFCFDKSRQNQRTRQALYNCVYPLYGLATVRTIQLLQHAMGYNMLYVALALGIVLVAAFGYWRFFRPQRDIRYNTLFRVIGWIVLAIALGLVVLELMLCPPH